MPVPGEGSNVVSFDLCLLAGSGVKGGQRWAVGFLVMGALGRAFPPHVFPGAG